MTKGPLTKILYLCEGSGYAGVESYALSLIGKTSKCNNMRCYAASFYPGPFIHVVKQLPVTIFQLHGQKNLRSLKKLLQIVNDEDIDIIHCVDLKSVVIGGILSIFLRKPKFVATMHGLPEYYRTFRAQVKYLLSLLLYFLVLRFVFDGKIFVSNDLKNRLGKLTGTRNASVIHNGIDLAGNEPPRKPKSPGEKRDWIIGTVGRLDTVKGHACLLEAARMLLDVRQDVIFQIIGTGPLEKDLIRLASELGVSDRVRFLGFRPDARFLIGNMDIFVLPSLHEGIPYVLLEAMSCARAVVCSEVGGLKEVIENLSDGILVKPKDAADLCRAMNEVMENGELYCRLGLRALEKIQKSFTSDMMAKKTKLVYDNL